MWKIIFIPILLLSLGCKKQDPNPELQDKIYQDLKAELVNTEAQIAEFEKKVAEMEKEMQNSKPQTGDFKRYQKYYYQYQNNLSRFKQQAIYWKIRIAQRKSAVQVEYSRAFEAQKPWPDPKEYDEYLARKKLRLAKIEWDIKQRISESKTGRNPAADSGHGAPAEH